ncbi:MAG: tRNA (N6-threonylcarbamoyladenosine(37)-N6)-methyltransferase TrmO [Promethearchaeota archaeon]|nr:MAG: tRNA (N6-threonylcarbamoyladenosine(37)-N6)-methyltransferase TrmO [Candidatus Lokiarchaeota archaeon]
MEITKRELIEYKDRCIPDKICFSPIGIIHSPFESLKGIPIQSKMSEAEGMLEIFPEYEIGLRALNGFSHIYCLYYFDMVKPPVPLQSKPFLSNEKKGVFATRTPFRPNPIGLSIFSILKVKINKIHVKNLDVLNRTPILDIKPYVPYFDNYKTNKIGWLQGNIKNKKS